MTFTTHHLAFTAEVQTPVELRDQAGSAIRGAIAGELWGKFCTNKAAPTCDACPLVKVCPVAALIAPMREEGETGGEQRPRPYVIQPPEGARAYARGERLSFQLVLFGSAAPLFPYVVMAAQGLEHSGLGRLVAANGGRRGTLRVSEIAAINPLTDVQQVLYQCDQRQVHAPGLPITAEDVAAYAATLPTDRLTLHLLTPLRLIDAKQLVQRFALRPFVMRLSSRLNELISAYSDGPRIDHVPLLAQVEHVQVVADHTRWIDVVSYSSRTHQRTPIGGLVGSVTLAGELGPLLELLVWGSLIHVGRNAVKGDGWYRVLGDG